MSGWLLAGLAGGMWLGLLARPLVGDRLPVAAWLVLAGAALAGAAALAPRAGVSTSPLEALLPGGDADVRLVAVAPERPGRRRGPPALVTVLALAGAIALGLGWGSAHAHRVQDGLLARLAPSSVSVDAVLRTDPRAGTGGWWAMADVRLVRAGDTSTTTVREAVWLSGDGRPPDAIRGDRVRITGRVLVPDDPGFETFLLRRGMVAQLEADETTRLGPSDVAFVRVAQSFRALVGGSIRERFPAREAGLLLGLSIGDDSMLDPALERDFRASGLSHLLVVSGGNVVMVLAPVLAVGALLRLSRWPRFVLGLGTVAFFVVLTGGEPSVLRAGVMAGLTLFGVFLGRPRSAWTILSAAVFGLLVLDAALVWSVGFQLSVAATAGMVALATPIADRLPWLPRPVALATGATLAAQIAVTPVLLFHFHEVPLSTLLANVLAFPAVAPALLLGLGAAFVALASPFVGAIVAGVALVPLRYLETIADRAARAPVPWITGGGAATLIVGFLVAGGLAWWIRSGRRPPRSVVVAAGALAPLLVWSSALTSGPPTALTVRFFDVGQGDAALLTSPGGVSILVDGGPDEAQIATELAALGVKRLDVVVASHPHADHVVGLPAVLARIPAALLLEPGCPTDSPDGRALTEAIAAERVPVRRPRADDVLVVGDVRLEVLSPDRCWTGTESDTNNDAIVLRASVGEDSVLFATEPEEPAQQVMLDEGLDLTADLLKVPHHGAATSIESFFRAVDPQIALVSVGENTYGHPVPEVLEWIVATGAQVLRTDRVGNVTVVFGPTGLLVETED
ncbi:MAG: DNA internalization-related competence protein ComEC/Rec2 [Actinomycetota bacterium]